MRQDIIAVAEFEHFERFEYLDYTVIPARKEIGRSVARGLVASSRPFAFFGYGWRGARYVSGGPVEWVRYDGEVTPLRWYPLEFCRR